MKEVVQVTRINQRKEVVLDRVPVSWLTRDNNDVYFGLYQHA
jgi:hypothetical protein